MKVDLRSFRTLAVKETYDNMSANVAQVASNLRLQGGFSACFGSCFWFTANAAWLLSCHAPLLRYFT